MQHQKIPFKDTKIFSSFFLDYISQKKSLQPFYSRFPTIDAFKSQIEEREKSFSPSSRQALYNALVHQYKDIETTQHVKNNLELLREGNSFTVTTGHQLNIFTGPLYFIYKIVSVINACKQLAAKYPSFNFIPVYWMASEDHDFEEISYFKLNGNKYKWETDQQGAVGRFNPASLKSILDELPGDVSIFEKAYLKQKTLSDAVRCYVNEIFGKDGLVIIDADERSLKSQLAGVINDDLFNHTAKSKVESTNGALQKLGYETQVFAREINFFYLDKGLRSRIEKDGQSFKVVDTNLEFDESAIKKMIDEEPEKFSPNVVLRPLYQEIVLPNLAYFGGPAEVIYWLQLKGVFDHYEIPFPILMPRNFALVLSGPVARKLNKTGLTLSELFEEKNFLFNHWVLKNTHNNLTLTQEFKLIDKLFKDLQERANEVDQSLNQMVAAENKRVEKSLSKIENKFLRAEKRHHTDKLRQIDEVKEALFPNGGLQERSDNFLNFYQQDKLFIQHLLQTFDPFDFQLNVLSYPYTD